MNGWTETGDGYRTKTVKSGNCTIVLRRPVLSEKERTKREGVVENALTNFARHAKGVQVSEA